MVASASGCLENVGYGCLENYHIFKCLQTGNVSFWKPTLIYEYLGMVLSFKSIFVCLEHGCVCVFPQYLLSYTHLESHPNISGDIKLAVFVLFPVMS